MLIQCFGYFHVVSHFVDISPQLTITSMTTESLGVSWTFDGDDIPEIRRVYISALYVGPCDNPLTPPPPVAVLTIPIPDSYIVTDLEDFSTYAVNVTVEAEEAREESTVRGTTVGIGMSGGGSRRKRRGEVKEMGEGEGRRGREKGRGGRRKERGS